MQIEELSPSFLFCLFSLLISFLEAHPISELSVGVTAITFDFVPFQISTHFCIFVYINFSYFDMSEVIHCMLLFVHCFPFRMWYVLEIFWSLSFFKCPYFKKFA